MFEPPTAPLQAHTRPAQPTLLPLSAPAPHWVPQELRDSLSRFRDAARPRGALTAAFAATYGEAGTPGMAQYLLASACDRVYMQPSGGGEGEAG